MKWPLLEMRQIADVIRGVSFDSSEVSSFPQPGFLPVLRAGNIRDGLNTESDLVWVPRSRVADEQLMREGDIVIAMSSGSASVVGKTARLDSDWHGAVGAFCAILRPKQKRVSRYLSFWLRGPAFAAWRHSQCMGANIQNLRKSELETVKLPFPSAKERDRIVQLLEQADGLRRRRKDADALADHIVPALFLKMFGDPAANPKRWPRETLGTLLHCIDSGWSPVCENRPAYPTEWGVLKLGAVTTNRYIESENKALPASETPLPALEVQPGDLLFSRKNTRELVGACAYVHATRPRLMLSDLVFRLRLRKDAQVHPLYLWALLTHPSKRPAIEMLAGGSAASMPNISKSRLQTLDIHKPPYRFQRDFAAAASRHYVLMSNAESAGRMSRALFGVLLDRAFNGKLTTDWPHIHIAEPADET